MEKLFTYILLLNDTIINMLSFFKYILNNRYLTLYFQHVGNVREFLDIAYTD